MCGCADVQMCGCADVRMCGCADEQMSRCGDVEMWRCADSYCPDLPIHVNAKHRVSTRCFTLVFVTI